MAATRFSLRSDWFDIVRRVGKLDPIWIHLLRHAMNRIEFRLGGGLGSGVVLGGPFGLTHKDDEEGGVESTLLHLGQVHLPVTAHTGIDIGSCKIGRDVIVGVDRQHMLVNRHRLRDQVGFGSRILNGDPTIGPAPTARLRDP